MNEIVSAAPASAPTESRSACVVCDARPPGEIDEAGLCPACGDEECEYCDRRAVRGRDQCKECIEGLAAEDILRQLEEDGGADAGAAVLTAVVSDWTDRLRVLGVQVDDLDVQSITVALGHIGAAASAGRRS